MTRAVAPTRIIGWLCADAMLATEAAEADDLSGEAISARLIRSPGQGARAARRAA